MKIYVAHSNGFDYVRNLYEPIKSSSLWAKHDVFLPHDGNQNVKTKEVIEEAELFVAEISFPSTGEGIELGWANAAGIRIVGLYRSRAKFPNSIRFVTSELHEYSGADDFVKRLASLVGEVDQKK